MKIAQALTVFIALWMSVPGFAQSAPTYTDIHVRTQSVDSMIVAVTNDGRFFSIICNYNLPVIMKSTGVMFMPNSDGDIVSTAYNKVVRSSADKRSPAIPLTREAVTKVCNEPNGVYVLRLKQHDQSMEVDYVSSSTLNAQSGQKGRGY